MNTNIRNIIEDALNARESILLELPTHSEIAVFSYDAQGAEQWKVEKRDAEGEVHTYCFHFNDEVIKKLSEYNIVGVRTFGKGTIPPNGSQEVTLGEVRAAAGECARKAQAYFQRLSCYEHCTEAMRLRQYANRTNDTEKIAKRALELLKDIESTKKSQIVENRAGEDKGKLIFRGMGRYKRFFLSII
ncbi:MAG: hypothetical protein LUD72_12225 [Bacteroidales bacterium]|nr:hypothetical protein [Bacteroidales bacterium]